MSGDGDSTTGLWVLETVAVAGRTIAVLLLAIMTIMIVGQVLGRNILDLGMPWADELARFCGVALVFLCIPLLALRGQHVAVDMVPMMLPARIRRWAVFGSEFLVLAFCMFGLWGLYTFLGRAWKFATPTLGIPNWVFYSPAVAGFALLGVVTVVRLVTVLRGGEPASSGSAIVP